MKIYLIIGLLLTSTLTFGQYPIESIYLTLMDGQHNIITDTSSTFKITFRQEIDSTMDSSGQFTTSGKNEKCEDSNFGKNYGVNIDRFAFLKYNRQYHSIKPGTWQLSFHLRNGVIGGGIYIIEITDTRTNSTMELLFYPFIACQEATIMHTQGRYYICTGTREIK